jgi:hypothetical protein
MRVAKWAAAVGVGTDTHPRTDGRHGRGTAVPTLPTTTTRKLVPPRTTGGDSHAYDDLVVRLRPRMHRPQLPLRLLTQVRRRRRAAPAAETPSDPPTAPPSSPRTSTSPSPWRGGDVAHRLIEAVYAFAAGFGPRQRLLAHPGVQRPGTLPIRHPRPSDIVRRIPALSLREDSPAVRPTPAVARGRSAALAQAEIAVFAGFPSSTCPRRSTSLNRRQSRRSSPTKINKEVIRKQVRNCRGEG